MKHNWYIVCSIPRVLGWSWINTHYGSNPFQIPRRWHVLSPPQICPIPAEQCNAWSLDESVQNSFLCRVQHLTRIDWFLISNLRVLVDIYKEKYKINLKAKKNHFDTEFIWISTFYYGFWNFFFKIKGLFKFILIHVGYRWEGLFVWNFSSHSRIFHSFEDVTIPGEGLQILTYICSASMAIEHWGFLIVPHLLWHGASVYNGHLRGPVILTPIAER